ncbi:unnamed protein product [Enterobius vermicularis]|uniref:ZP domain-containing protein n=1 Tax=Enterobius vermicularis TaxID=51028 RepID=A0A0N4UV96_ENTVE|nr:unnamed protein product [Enterobius vermicularis]
MCQERFFALLLWHFLLYVAKSDPFWITTNVQEVKWKQDCPAVLACVDTTFVLVQNNLVSSSLVGYWAQGSPEGISVAVEMVGFDSTYGFPRVCDSSDAVPLYMVRRMLNEEGTADQKTDNNDKTVELTGLCFSARFTLKIHVERCPWCDTAEIVKQDVSPAGSMEDISHKEDAGNFLTVLLVSLAVLAGIGFFVVFLLFTAIVLHRKSFFKPKIRSSYPVVPQERTERKDYFALANPYWISGNLGMKDLSLEMSAVHPSERTSNISLGGPYQILSVNSSERWSPCDSGVITV